MAEHLLKKYSAAVPRYTSYPTAPHFHLGIGAGEYSSWLQALDSQHRLSLYVHIPYCDRLCWFCACHTKHTLRYEPIAAYLKALHCEIEAACVERHPRYRRAFRWRVANDGQAAGPDCGDGCSALDVLVLG